MNQAIYDELVRLAIARRLTAYSDVAPLAGLNMGVEHDRVRMSELLREIAQFEQANYRPMLTALVIHRGDDNNPGDGFFAIAEEFGLFRGSRDHIVRTTFWSQQVADVFEHWRP